MTNELASILPKNKSAGSFTTIIPSTDVIMDIIVTAQCSEVNRVLEDREKKILEDAKTADELIGAEKLDNATAMSLLKTCLERPSSQEKSTEHISKDEKEETSEHTSENEKEETSEPESEPESDNPSSGLSL